MKEQNQPVVEAERIENLNQKSINYHGKYVLYWMESSQRTLDNHALIYALREANKLSLPIKVVFTLQVHYPFAHQRQYYFMLQGLRSVAEEFRKNHIDFIVLNDKSREALSILAREAALVITDVGYLKNLRSWRQDLAEMLGCRFIALESNVLIPVRTVSSKEEYSAATFRTKYYRQIERFLRPESGINDFSQEFEQRLRIHKEAAQGSSPHSDSILPKEIQTAQIDLVGRSNEDLKNLLSILGMGDSVGPVDWVSGGQQQAIERLHYFINHHLKFYDSLRNDPANDFQSNLSPYLHFGQISPLRIAQEVLLSEAEQENYLSSTWKSDRLPLKYLSPGAQAFLEELLIRRELAINFCFYNSNYDNLGFMQSWAKETMEVHKDDTRAHIYDLETLRSAKTHDSYWNAAQREMLYSGKMHGYMRMYWAKKIMEWTPNFETAFEIIILLNDTYFIDGRDPNGYTGIAWCFGKHDRPWKERPIFGKLRYMNAKGLERKFRIVEYVKRIEQLTRLDQ